MRILCNSLRSFREINLICSRKERRDFAKHSKEETRTVDIQ